MQMLLKFFLRSGQWDNLVSGIVSFLSSTVKNPQSNEALRLIAGVRTLRNACTQFLRDLGSE